MSLPLITPQQAKARVAEGARLIDIRDTDEYAREHISGAESVPLATLPGGLNARAGEIVLFHCQSGARTSGNADRGQAASPAQAFVVEGAFRAGSRPGC